jgi:hypothetical protein
METCSALLEKWKQWKDRVRYDYRRTSGVASLLLRYLTPNAVLSLFLSRCLPTTVVYYGLVDQENATANDAVIIDANMYFHMTGYTHEQNLFNAVEMPLCHDGLGSDENNQYGACPNDGAYTFDTVYNMPEVDSPYFGWAATGWSGEVVLDMYLNSTMDLVGKCTMEVQTMVTGSYEEGAFRSMPSAKATTLTVFGVLAACLIGCMYCCWCKSKSKQAFSKEEGLLADTDDETATGQYLM